MTEETTVAYEIKKNDEGLTELYVEGQFIFSLAEDYSPEQIKEVYDLAIGFYQKGISDIRGIVWNALGPVPEVAEQ